MREGRSLLVVGLCALALAGCDKGRDRQPAPAAAATSSATASATVIPASVKVNEPAEPIGAGVGSFIEPPAACNRSQAIIAEYLQRDGLALAASDSGIAAAWFVQLPRQAGAQVAFGGFDLQARSVARPRGVGSTKEEVLRLFASGAEWTVAWFDDEGLAWVRPRWDALPAPTLSHLGAIARDMSDQTALGVADEGRIAAVAPFGAERSQLGVFLFEPTAEGAPMIRAVGVTRQAKAPKRPALAVGERGYYLAWQQEGGLVASFFDKKGKEGELVSVTKASAGAEPPVLVRAGAGALVFWRDGGGYLVRALGPAGEAAAAVHRLGKGAALSAIAAEDGALVSYLDGEGRPVLVHVDASGKAAASGLIIADAKATVAPALALAGSRIAIGWAEPMGSSATAARRARLAVIDAACVPR